jgi:hypothetical protein
VFQVHGVDAAGQVVIRRKLKRRYGLAFFQKLPPCLVGIEACASSHYCARELQALRHKVRDRPSVGDQRGEGGIRQSPTSSCFVIARPEVVDHHRALASATLIGSRW